MPQARRTPLISGQEICYVAVKPCGCVVAALVPEFCSTRDIGYRVAPWMRKGWTIERMRVGEARNALQRCTHEAAPARQGDLFRRTHRPRTT